MHDRIAAEYRIVERAFLAHVLLEHPVLDPARLVQLAVRLLPVRDVLLLTKGESDRMTECEELEGDRGSYEPASASDEDMTRLVWECGLRAGRGVACDGHCSSSASCKRKKEERERRGERAGSPRVLEKVQGGRRRARLRGSRKAGGSDRRLQCKSADLKGPGRAVRGPWRGAKRGGRGPQEEQRDARDSARVFRRSARSTMSTLAWPRAANYLVELVSAGRGGEYDVDGAMGASRSSGSRVEGAAQHFPRPSRFSRTSWPPRKDGEDEENRSASATTARPALGSA